MNLKPSIVSIVRTGSKPGDAEIAGAVRESIRMAGGLRDIVSPGSLIIVKPNLVAPPSILPGKSMVLTNPLISKTIADLVSEAGGRPIIAEASAYGMDTEAIMEEAGYTALRDEGYEVVNLKKTRAVKVPVPKGEVLKEAEIYELATQAQAIISVPVLKMHSMAGVSLSLKCMKGFQSDRYKVRMHRMGLLPGVAELCNLLRPAFAVVDGIFAVEGLGHPVEMDVVIAGRDPVAVDAVGSQVMGLDPRQLEVLKRAEQLGVGTMDPERIQVVGTPVEAVQRRLMLPEEDRPLDIDGFKLVHAEGTCTSCRNMVLSTLGFMKNTPLLENFRGLTIITGDAEIPHSATERSLVSIGNCVPKPKRGKRFVMGCPPHPWDICAEVAEGVDKVIAAMPSLAEQWFRIGGAKGPRSK